MHYLRIGEGRIAQTAIATFVHRTLPRRLALIGISHIGTKLYYDEINNAILAHEADGFQVVSEGFAGSNGIFDREDDFREAMERFNYRVSERTGIWEQRYLLPKRSTWLCADMDMSEFLTRARAIHPMIADIYARGSGHGNTPEAEAEYVHGMMAVYDAAERDSTLYAAWSTILTESLREDLVAFGSSSKSVLIQHLGEMYYRPDVRSAVQEIERLLGEAREAFVYDIVDSSEDDLCVVYGASHGVAFERQFERLGFVRTSEEWVDVSVIPEAVPSAVLERAYAAIIP